MPRQRRITGPSHGGTVFGECLGTLMRGFSVRTLANQMNIDRNLIYMWLRGERLPTPHSGHVDRLADTLRLSQSDRQTLFHALQESLDSRRPRKHTPRSGIEAAGDLIATAWSTHGSALDERFILENLGFPAASRRLVISGSQNVIMAAIDIVARAPGNPGDGARDIFVTYQGSKSAFESNPRLLDPWNAAVSSALRKGYRLHALWRLDRNVARSIHLAKDTLALVGRAGGGAYQPMYMPRTGVVDPPFDLVIVPHHEALTMYATTQSMQVDAAFRVRESARLEILFGHAQQCAAVSESLLTFYGGLEGEASHRAGMAADIEVGRRIVLKGGLSTMTRPLSWFEHPERLEGRTWRSGEKFSSWINRERYRLSAFLKAASTGSFRDMCPMSAITRLLVRGEYYRWDGVPRVERDMAREHVENVIRLLKELKGYELALLDGAETRKIEPRFCMVHGDVSVILEFEQTTSGHSGAVKMQITEQRIVGAFWEHLEELWNSLRLRDKADCIRWLEEEVKRVG